MSTTKHYRYGDCDLTAHGLLLACDAHDNATSKNLVVRPRRDQNMPCWRAKQFWYQDSIPTSIESEVPDNMALDGDGQTAIINSIGLGTVSNEIIYAMVPFRGIIYLLGDMTDEQIKYVASHTTYNNEVLAEYLKEQSECVHYESAKCQCQKPVTNKVFRVALAFRADTGRRPYRDPFWFRSFLRHHPLSVEQVELVMQLKAPDQPALARILRARKDFQPPATEELSL